MDREKIMQKLENRVAHLRKYIGKTFTPRVNGVFTVDDYHRVKITSIDSQLGVHYVYVHKLETGCPIGKCQLINIDFSQPATNFFTHIKWRERNWLEAQENK